MIFLMICVRGLQNLPKMVENLWKRILASKISGKIAKNKENPRPWQEIIKKS